MGHVTLFLKYVRKVEFHAQKISVPLCPGGSCSFMYPPFSTICDQAVLLPRRLDSRDGRVHLVADNRHNAFVTFKSSDFIPNIVGTREPAHTPALLFSSRMWVEGQSAVYIKGTKPTTYGCVPRWQGPGNPIAITLCLY